MDGPTVHIPLGWNRLFTVLAILCTVPTVKVLFQVLPWLRSVYKRRQAVKDIPGEDPHWFWGNLLQIPAPGEKSLAWGYDLTLRFPRMNKMFVGWWQVNINLRHPDLLKKILQTSEPKPMSNAGGYKLLKPWLGDGLLVSSGEKWFRNRKLLTPGFHFDVLKPYMAVYNQAVDILIGKWEAESERSSKSIEIYKHVNLCTLDVMLRCAFSHVSDVQSSENKYVDTVNSLAELLIERALKPWLLIDSIYYRTDRGKKLKENCRYAHQVAHDLINKRKKLLDENPELKDKRYVDFLDILLLAKDEHGQGLTTEEIRNEVDTFLFEGHDTTASAISWLLYSLAKHEDAQEKCRQELKNVTGDREEATIEWDDLQKLPYLTQCVKESLRMYPPVPVVQRMLSKHLEVDGHTLLPGTVIGIVIYGLHHNPKVWGEDHEEFKPDRFNPENIQKMDSHAFLPFSAGPRNCIGQNFAMHEIKVIVARVLMHFKLSVDKEHIVERLPLLVMRAKYGLKLHFEAIEKA